MSKKWDDPENETKNSFVSWGAPGDYFLGVMLRKKQVKSALPDMKGEMQWVYEAKVRECSYHVLDDSKQVVPTALTPDEGDIVSIGGRASIDSRMANIKVGQVFGLKFIETRPAKTKGFNPVKVIKVFTPKMADGEFEMDTEVVAGQGEFQGKI